MTGKHSSTTRTSNRTDGAGHVDRGSISGFSQLLAMIQSGAYA